MAEMDEVIVLIYDAPETTSIPLDVRAGWIRSLYPDVRVIEAWDGPTAVGDTHEIRTMHESYIRDVLGIRKVTAFYSSEFYGKHMSHALEAENRIVDEERQAVPVSASQIRENPYACRKYLHPLVYRDLVTNVVFLGAPSTGKTTLAECLAKEYGTVWMPEYGREYWEQHQKDRRLSPEQLVDIARIHLQKENEMLSEADRYLFTDTNALTTAVFSRQYHCFVHQDLERLAKEAETRYDLVFLCGTDIPYDNTWDRSGEGSRETFQKRIISDLRIRRVPFIPLSGTLEERIALVRRVLASHMKFMNPYEIHESICTASSGEWNRLNGFYAT
jgi:NadR type nicotinamide-nucleotide adenylyltransferase